MVNNYDLDPKPIGIIYCLIKTNTPVSIKAEDPSIIDLSMRSGFDIQGESL